MRWLFTIICGCLTFIAFAQSANLRTNRTSYILTVSVDSATVYQDSIQSGPFINGPNILQLYPGEEVFLEVKEDNGVISQLTSVKENAHPERTLKVSFTQTVVGRKHEMMVLKIVNPFKSNLTYSAMTFLLKQNKWVKTTVVPVRAGLSSYETWPDIIITLGLSDWKFITD